MNRREFFKLAAQSGFVLACSGSVWASQSGALSDVAFLTPADSEYPERAILFNAHIVRTPKTENGPGAH